MTRTRDRKRVAGMRWLVVLGLSLALWAPAASGAAYPLMDGRDCSLPGQLLKLETDLATRCGGGVTTTYGTEVESPAQPADGSIGWVAWTAASAGLLLAGAGLGVGLFRIRARSARSQEVPEGRGLDRLALGR